MSKRRWVLLVSLAILLIGPFLVPVSTTGTSSNDELVSTGELVQTGDYRTYVVSRPSNSENLIVLLHGFGANSTSWDQILTPLAKYGSLIAYDRPAFGLTDRPTDWSGTNPYSSEGSQEQLSAVLKFGEAQSKKVILVGHSAGALVATQYALDHPGDIDALVLVAPAILGGGGAPGWLNWLFFIPQLDHVGPLLVSGISESGLQILRDSFFDQSKITQQTYDNYQLPLKVAGWERAFWEFNRAPRSFDAASRLEELGIPVLIITGESDEIVDPYDSVLIRDRIAGSRLEYLTKLGHLPHEEDPDRFMKALMQNWSWLTR